jgi:hypothetical protein
MTTTTTARQPGDRTNLVFQNTQVTADKVLQLRRQREARTAQSKEPNAHREPK